ncbi:hypothetical protein LCGC14_0483970 [marine sediment metagenome]|uniref:Uncharacterized protein n=1 Tax=marine sediment metagenome TaxID=412755 RepID=A0A0F9UVN0_9ZZZZ
MGEENYVANEAATNVIDMYCLIKNKMSETYERGSPMISNPVSAALLTIAVFVSEAIRSNEK